MPGSDILSDEKLANLVGRAGLVKETDLQKALQKRRGADSPFDQLLMEMNLVTKEDLGNLLEQEFGVPYVNLHMVKVPEEILRIVPERRVKTNLVVPITKEGEILTVAMADPKNIILRDQLELVTSLDIKPVVATESSLLRFIERYYEIGKIERVLAREAGAEISEKEIQELAKTPLNIDRIKSGDEDAPIIKLVKAYVTEAVRMRASDIHIEPQEEDLIIRYRIDGILHTAHLLKKQIHPQLSSCIKVMAEIDITERRLPQDGQIRLQVLDRDIDIRVSTLPGKYGEKLALRVLDKTSFLLGISELGFSTQAQSGFEELIKKPHGIILVVGPTGSGKTTTLYVAINKIKNPMKNIITLEDPIEYELLAGHKREAGITQVQINPKIGLDFALGLRHTLRQDPDIIMVGEIRDLETAETSMRAALTGHLVFSSLHTNGSVESITRLLDMGIPPYLAASSLEGIVAQRLVRTLCSRCKEPYQVPARLLERLGMTSEKKAVTTFYRAKGCEFCGNKGYSGRTGVFELLIIDDSIRSLILENVPSFKIKEKLKGKGWRSLWEEGLRLLSEGITTMDELIHVVPSGER